MYKVVISPTLLRHFSEIKRKIEGKRRPVKSLYMWEKFEVAARM
jgi:hypothetical protein